MWQAMRFSQHCMIKLLLIYLCSHIFSYAIISAFLHASFEVVDKYLIPGVIF